MLIETSYVFFSLLLVIYSAWRYAKLKEKYMLYLTLSFTFLAFSSVFQMLDSLIWIYGILASVTMLRLVELGGLGLYACFTISSIITLKKISDTKDESAFR